MIGKVTTGQSVRAVVLAGLLWLTVVGGLFGGCTYYFFGYPRRVAEKAMATLKQGQDLKDVLAEGSEFMRYLNLNKIGPILYFQGEGNWDQAIRCGTVMQDRHSHSWLLEREGLTPKSVRNVTESSLTIPALLKEHARELAECQIIRTDFMPALFYRCTVEIAYDRQFRVQRWWMTRCWD
jgi:hypothetical protein